MTRRKLIRDAAAMVGLPAMIETFLFAAPVNAAVFAPDGKSERFRHPGILHTADDLRFIREKLNSGAEPWTTAFAKLKADKIADMAAEPKPVARVYRGVNNNPDIGSSALGHDSGAAYVHALIGAISLDAGEATVHFKKSIDYLDAWSGTLAAIDGHDQKLLCGLTGYRFANAAELILHAGNVPSGLWPKERADALVAMLTGIFYPPIKDLYLESNGNWDAAMVTTMLSIGILTDDRRMFDRACDFYLNSGGNGAITSYVYPSGQCEETTRDQGHVQLGLGMMATACRIAWSQGVDLYGAANNRLALGFEYTARLNLGFPVNCDSGVPGPKSMGSFQPIYESVFQHYAVGKGIPMPYTHEVLKRKRPEGYDGSQPGFGTLTTFRDANSKGDGPAIAVSDQLRSVNPIDSGPVFGLLKEALLPVPGAYAKDRSEEFVSPSGNLTVTYGITGGKFTYSLRDKAGHDLIMPSECGITFDGGVAPLIGNFAIWEIAASRRELARLRLYGEHGESDPYTSPKLPFEQRIVTLRETAAPNRILRVEIRAYDAGMALRLTLPPNRDAGTFAKRATEKTEFVFPENAIVYESYGNEDEFRPVKVADLKKGNWLPFTVQAGAKRGPYISILEVDASTDGLPQTLLSPSLTNKNAVLTDPRGTVRVGTESSTQFHWRIILAGETPEGLAENSRIVSSFWPEPDATLLSAFEWVKPGKAIREVTLSTPGGMACIDFAASHGLSYILLDAGWYGPENDDASDARSVSVDRAKVGPNHPGLDLTAVIAYGKAKGIGVFLYVNHKAAEKQLPDLAPLYQSWGVAGIKFGFVTVGPVEWTRWMRDSVALCAKHKLLVDIHDAYRPVGLSGSYPNLLNQEGIRGNEHMPTPRHNCTLPFTRMLSGPADYTVCYRVSRLQTTDAHQMALSVLYYAPFEMLYWYGQPKEFEGLPEIEFFKGVPTVWDETVWLGGEIGEWAAVARRSGRDWFIAAITNESSRAISLPLSFLPDGEKYALTGYADKLGPDDKPDRVIKHGVTRISIETKTVRRADTLEARLMETGGMTWKLTPSA